MTSNPGACTAIIASHRLKPGHLSHMLANAQLLMDAGWKVVFRWPPSLAVLTGDAKTLPLAENADLRRLG